MDYTKTEAEWKDLAEKNPYIETFIFSKCKKKKKKGYHFVDVPFYFKGLKTLVVERRLIKK